MIHEKFSYHPLILALLVILATMMVSIPTVNADSNFKTVRHDPSGNITSDDEVTIYTTLNNTDNVTSVQYQFCEIDPLGTCSLDADMTDLGGGQYSAVIPENDGGTTMGYKITIEYDDGRDEEYSPSKDSYHEYYIEKDPESDDDDSPFIPAPLFVLAIIMATLIIKKRN